MGLYKRRISQANLTAMIFLIILLREYREDRYCNPELHWQSRSLLLAKTSTGSLLTRWALCIGVILCGTMQVARMIYRAVAIFVTETGYPALNSWMTCVWAISPNCQTAYRTIRLPINYFCSPSCWVYWDVFTIISGTAGIGS